jgi:hypothetical protein
MRRSVTLLACGLILLAGCVGVPQTGQTNTEPSDSIPTYTGESPDTDSQNRTESTDSQPTVEHIGPYSPTEFEYSWAPPRNATVEEIVVGERSTDDETQNSTADEPQPHPHTYTIWNNDRTNHRVRINVSRQANVIRNESYRVPSNGTITITLAEPARYTTTITVSGEGNVTSELRISEDANDFDCNATWVQVAILSDGKTDATVSSTLVMCPGDQ